MRQIIIIFASLTFFTHTAVSLPLYDHERQRVKIFYTMTDRSGWEAVTVGKVLSCSSMSMPEKNDLTESLHEKNRVTVRLFSKAGVKKGDTLFVIDRRNLIIAKLFVTNIFKSKSFNYLLIGTGNFKLTIPGSRVVERREENDSRHAYIYVGRGDYFYTLGRTGRAIHEYENALSIDKGNPEAHLRLGYTYKKRGLPRFAFKEFSEAYRNISRLYDNGDKFSLLKGMTEIRFDEIYNSYLPAKIKRRYRRDVEKYSLEALKIYPDSVDIHYILGVLYYRSAAPQDKKARKHLLRAVSLDSSHAESYIALSELYYRHKNMKKAYLYAKKAVDSDRSNERARELLKYIRNSRKGAIQR